MIQLDFFKEPPTEMELLHEEMLQTKESSNKVRRGTYAKINKLAKEIEEIKNEFNSWKKMLCKGEI